MALPALDRGTVLFIPSQGIFQIDAISQQSINNQPCEICDLRHLFSNKTYRQARSGLERSNARAPTSHQIACDVVGRLRQPPRHQRGYRWYTQKNELEGLLKIGTLEKNVKALRILHSIDTDHWKTNRVIFYQHVLDQVTEELAFVFDETREQVRRIIITTLNDTALEHL